METTQNVTSADRVGALEITVNLFSFILMWVSLFATGSILFNVINYYFPDPLATNYYSTDLASFGAAITYAIAALVISLPLYILSIRYWLKKFTGAIAHTEARLSRFLTYVILLAVALTIVGDLISLLYNFLQGEFGMRFVLKSLTVLLLAVITAFFYYHERKIVQFKKEIPHNFFRTIGIVAVVVAVVSVVLGFVVGGSPMTQRSRRVDAIRTQDMEQIASSISSFVWDTGRLPASLNELARNQRYSYVRIVDPATKTPYEYYPSTTTPKILSFELCTTFTLEASSTSYTTNTPNTTWSVHPAGRHCVTQEATKSPAIAPYPASKILD